MLHLTCVQGFALSCCLLALGTASSASAQITPDTTLPVNSVVPEGCNRCFITGGTQEGGNLFHSFDEFSIPNRGSARFVHGPDVNLIFSRVTGDSPSLIRGLLGTSGTTDLFFINPNGIVFGRNSAIDVGGSFVASTAAGMTFADDTQFMASLEPTSLLTMTAPVGLQFEADPGDVVNQFGGLRGSPGATVALIGGEVRFVTSALRGSSITTSDGGHVELGSVVGKSSVWLQPSEAGWSFNYSNASGFEDITLGFVGLNSLSDRDVGAVSGSAHLQAQNVLITGAIEGKNLGDEPGGTIQVDAAGLLHLKGGHIGTDAGGTQSIKGNPLPPSPLGAAGNIQVNSQNLRVEEGGSIWSTGISDRVESGIINIRVQDLVEVLGSSSRISILRGTTTTLSPVIRIESARLSVRDGGNIISNILNPHRTFTGDISVIASEGIQLIGREAEPIVDRVPGSRHLGSRTGIFAVTTRGRDSFDVPDPDLDLQVTANINIQTTQLEILDGAEIGAASVGSFAFANSGDVKVNATEFIRLRGSDIFTSADIRSTRFSSSFGNAGDLLVTTPQLIVESGARIHADTLNSGSGGDVTLDVGQLRVLNGGEVSASSLAELDDRKLGLGGRLNIHASELVEISGTEVFEGIPINSTLSTIAEGTGPAGDIAIETPLLVVADGGEITASTVGLGGAGTVRVDADALSLTSGGKISSTTAGEGEGGNVDLTLQDKLTLADGGEISVSTAGLGDAGAVRVSADALIVTSGGSISSATEGDADSGSIVLTLQNELTLADKSEITASTSGQGVAGTVKVNANALRVTSGSEISSTTVDEGEGGNVDLTVQEELTLADGGEITASTAGEGGAGTVKVDADALSITSGGRISSTTTGTGEGGNVDLTVQEKLTLADGGEISVSTTGRGEAGTVDVTGGALSIAGGSRISSTTEGDADSGSIVLALQEELTLADGGEITASTSGQGDAGTVKVDADALWVGSGSRISSTTEDEGKGGNVDLTVQEELTLAGAGEITASARGQGSAGTVKVNADALSITSDGKISSTTAGAGDGGNVDLTLEEGLTLADGGEISVSTMGLGEAGNVNVTGGALSITGGGRISSATAGDADSGSIVLILEEELTLADGGEITASTTGQGIAGTVKVNADALSITSDGKISSTTAGAGDGGNVDLTVQKELALADSGEITARTTGRGAAGTVKVTADALSITSGGRISSTTASAGDGGNIDLTVQEELTLVDGGEISVSSLGSGIGGNIDLRVNVLSLDNGSRIEAETASANGGNVTLSVDDWAFLSDSSLISATAGTSRGAGDGGNVVINLADGYFIATKGTDSDIIARAFEGTGGNISMSARGIYGLEERPAVPGNGTNDIDASSQFGQSGTISLSDPTVDPSEADVELPSDAINAAELADRRCQADAGQGQSSLVITGRGGLPPDPAQIVRSDGEVLTELEFDEVSSEVADPSGQGLTKVIDAVTSEPPTRVIEAQTWERNASGQAVLMTSRNSSYRPQSAHPCQ